MSLKTFVINLERSVERRNEMRTELSRHNYLEYEFFSAVDGRNLSETERQSLFNIEKFQNNYARPVLAGEIGCTLSHQKCYKAVIDNQYPYVLILEDDIHIIEPFDCVLPHLEEILSGQTPVIILFSGFYYFTNSKKLFDKYNITKFVDGYLTHAYLINYEAAKLMQENKPYFHADDWRLFKKKGINIYGIKPHIVNQSENLTSEIVLNNEQRLSFNGLFIQRYFRKFWHFLFKLTGHYEPIF